MRKTLALFAAATVLVTAGYAQAYTPPPGWPERIRVDPSEAARTMAPAATYIDLVVAERFTSDLEFATRSHDLLVGWAKTEEERAGAEAFLASERTSYIEQEGAARIHYRVLEHLKGKGPEQFELNGRTYVDKPRPFQGTQELKFSLNQRDLADWQGGGNGEMEIFATLGGVYLIFRDADGRLLRTPTAYRFKRGGGLLPGPAHTRVNGAQDPWVKRVRAAIASGH